MKKKKWFIEGLTVFIDIIYLFYGIIVSIFTMMLLYSYYGMSFNYLLGGFVSMLFLIKHLENYFENKK